MGDTMRAGWISGDRMGLHLPEEDGDGFDERALEEAMREYRRREFAALAQLDS